MAMVPDFNPNEFYGSVLVIVEFGLHFVFK